MTSAATPTETLANALQRIRPDVRAMAGLPRAAMPPGCSRWMPWKTPFTLPPALQAALGQRLGALEIEPLPRRRAEAAAGGSGAAMRTCPPGCELMLGNGSDELITLLVSLACAQPGANGAGTACRAL